MISQGINHTAYDVMREYMITGAELDGKYQIPMMERYTDRPGEDTVDFNPFLPVHKPAARPRFQSCTVDDPPEVPAGCPEPDGNRR